MSVSKRRRKEADGMAWRLSATQSTWNCTYACIWIFTEVALPFIAPPPPPPSLNGIQTTSLECTLWRFWGLHLRGAVGWP